MKVIKVKRAKENKANPKLNQVEIKSEGKEKELGIAPHKYKEDR